jgi:hypothetical protein
MAMSLNRICDLLLVNEVSAIVYPLNTHEEQQTLLIPLQSGLNRYLLELRQNSEGRSWTISEKDEYKSFATSESSPKESQSMKSPAASSYDQLSLWPLESSK